MAKTSFVGLLRQYGSNSKNATPAVFPGYIQFSFDPTQASAGTGKILPKGSKPIAVRSLGGATGGTFPIANIGTSVDPDGFALGVASDLVTAEVVTGALLGVELTEDTEIYAGVGDSAPTGGTTTIVVAYIMVDEGK